MTLTKEEIDFLTGVLTNVVPNLQVPVKDAQQILSISESILTKLKGE